MSTVQTPSANKKMLHDAAIILFRRSKKKTPVFEALEEIQLIPYLDVMMNLVIFMLVTIASFLPLGILTIYPPKEAKGEGDAGVQQPALMLTVAIGESGYHIAGTGATLGPIAKKPDGGYDYDSLTKKAIEIKQQFPQERTVNIVADQFIRYEILIKTMDALRTDGKQLLFDDVKLSPEAS
ncbi:MAG: biopolymer transporter ExbD [Deltaproteobacteria bacterium]|nr:biopolymer transporter ExbD [Deltaproteobacteria bacterium]